MGGMRPDIEQISREYLPRIYRAALVLCGNPWDADDLAQETFLVLASQYDKFRGHSALFTWLYGILLNLDRRQRRRYGSRRRALRVIWELDRPDARTAPSADTAVEVAEWKASLWSWVALLPDGQRETLVLRFSEGLRYDQIATVLQCPLGTVKSRIFNGLEALRRLIRDDEDSAELQLIPLHPNEDAGNAI